MTIIAEDVTSRELLALAARVASTDVSILIEGESGVGKEVLAQFIHQHSPRAAFPFVAVNCAAIPETMLEASLFGYDKGAFTGAIKDHEGKFEQAQGGTLLLDEISEMALPLQSKLLRVLQERELERLGSKRTIQLDVRIIATTNCRLKENVKNGTFRQDLFYRLNTFPLYLAPLRARRDDIIPLAEYLLKVHAKKLNRTRPILTNPCKEKLRKYDWPGNVRELENVIQRALILQSRDILEPSDLVMDVIFAPQSEHKSIKRNEQEFIYRILTENRGDRSKTAQELQITPRSLRYKLEEMRECGFDIPPGKTSGKREEGRSNGYQ